MHSHQSGRVASSQLRLKILYLLKRNCKHLHGQAPVVSKLLGPLPQFVRYLFCKKPRLFSQGLHRELDTSCASCISVNSMLTWVVWRIFEIRPRCQAAFEDPNSKVLVHCVLGVNRSATIIVAWLLETRCGMGSWKAKDSW